MQVYLGLGSNLGDRREHLRRSIARLQEKGFQLSRVSPVIESPALLPEGAPADWNLPYLNLVLEGDFQGQPAQLRASIIEIQAELGRSGTSRWSPRPIDIDILLWGQEQISIPELTIPHRDIHRRGFVLTPLVALSPRLRIPGYPDRILLDWTQELRHHIPLWMGIVNITPDSFSDGGRFTAWEQIEPHIQTAVQAGAQIIDLGAESTRPGAQPIAADAEWQRLRPILERVLEQYQANVIRPLISIDTYHVEVAQRALELGADIINDVSGLRSPAMRELAHSSGKDWIAMHNLGIPASKDKTLPADCDPVETVEHWLIEQLEQWDKAGLDLSRIIFDPGIGFGKDGLQSLKLLRQARRFRQHGVRVLLGHSRKSFMKNFSAMDIQDKDLTTVGAALNLCAQGVDIIRVHSIPMHLSAYRGWTHLNEP